MFNKYCPVRHTRPRVCVTAHTSKYDIISLGENVRVCFRWKFNRDLIKPTYLAVAFVTELATVKPRGENPRRARIREIAQEDREDEDARPPARGEGGLPQPPFVVL